MSDMKIRRITFAICGILALAACEEGTGLDFLKPAGSGEEAVQQTETRMVEREVEAPEIFQVSEDGLWSGTPDFGGVWVAYPGVANPEQVIIRNLTTGGFVIGALFDRERDNPGPRLIVSSDAASALGLLAGQPTRLSVTALRKEQVPVEPEIPEETVDLEAPEEITAEPLDDPIAAASAAIARAEDQASAASTPVGDISPAAASSSKTTPVATAPKPKPQISGLEKPFIQIGIFSVEANAEGVADNLRKSGVVPTVKPGEVEDKPFWRVVIGPATNASERSALLEKAKELGFGDAYFVTN